jgi:hypothetical protein
MPAAVRHLRIQVVLEVVEVIEADHSVIPTTKDFGLFQDIGLMGSVDEVGGD